MDFDLSAGDTSVYHFQLDWEKQLRAMRARVEEPGLPEKFRVSLTFKNDPARSAEFCVFVALDLGAIRIEEDESEPEFHHPFLRYGVSSPLHGVKNRVIEWQGGKNDVGHVIVLRDKTISGPQLMHMYSLCYPWLLWSGYPELDGDGRASLSPDDPVRVSIGFYNRRVADILIVMI